MQQKHIKFKSHQSSIQHEKTAYAWRGYKQDQTPWEPVKINSRRDENMMERVRNEASTRKEIFHSPQEISGNYSWY
jgi:hypothetical protein